MTRLGSRSSGTNGGKLSDLNPYESPKHDTEKVDDGEPGDNRISKLAATLYGIGLLVAGLLWVTAGGMTGVPIALLCFGIAAVFFYQLYRKPEKFKD